MTNEDDGAHPPSPGGTAENGGGDAKAEFNLTVNPIDGNLSVTGTGDVGRILGRGLLKNLPLAVSVIFGMIGYKLLTFDGGLFIQFMGAVALIGGIAGFLTLLYRRF